MYSMHVNKRRTHSVGVRTSVGHRKIPSTSVSQTDFDDINDNRLKVTKLCLREVLISEFATVDGLATSAVSSSEISA